MQKMLRTLSAAAAVAILATACADAPDETATGAPSDAATASEATPEPDATTAAFRACQVTDTGGVDDRSFNQTAYAGITNAEAELGVEGAVLESTTDADYAPNIAQFVSDGCDLIVTVGFLLDGATQDAAKANPDQDFAIIDVDFAEFDADGNFVQDLTYDNVRELNFATDQAAFLAGYVAAATSASGKVGTYGGIPIPPVTIFMDGFLAGVRYHNQEKGTNVEVLGWDGTDGLFTGNFDSQDDGRNLTDQLIASGADIIMPVAGPVGLGTVAAVEDANAGGSDIKVIWVDTDGRVSVPNSKDVFLTSVQKNMDIAVFDSIELKVNGAFEGGPYLGTLDNGGVGIPTDGLPEELVTELDALRTGVIAGDISVKPGDYS